MEIKQAAMVGTLESSDIQISIYPNEGQGLDIQLQSIVKAQFGDSIIATMTEVLNDFEIKDAAVTAMDKGALDWVIKARMQAACCRATGTTFNWKGEDER